MTLVPRPDSSRAIEIELTEWDRIGPEQDPRLRGTSLDVSARRLADALRSHVDIREGRLGLEIESNSRVGRLDVGPLRIGIRPKLPGIPLARLLRYAYGLRNLHSVEETRAPTTRQGLHDLLIAMLADEVEELLHRGLARRYVSRSESLESPRGRILMGEVVRDGGITEARLPCQYVERRANWHLNQVLRAGLEVAARMTGDRDLRRRVNRLADMFGDVERNPRLDAGDTDRAKRSLTRLTAANGPALTIIRLLQDMQGVAFDPERQLSQMPGFLFDMNVFFQRLLSRFLHENLSGQRIEDEWPIRSVFAYSPGANPRQRRAPRQRPDFALFRGEHTTRLS